MSYVDKDFKFDLSVSTQAFPQKPQANVVKDIKYTTETLTIDELEQRVRDGYAFCYNFLPTDSGVLSQQDRHIDRFDYTQTVFYDFDKMPMSMEEFIETLRYKPSLAYTTYSNGTNGKYGYRLVYAFRLRISNERDFEKTYRGLAAANGFKQGTYPDGTKYGIDFRKVNQQYYGGGERTTTWKSYNTYFDKEFSSNTLSITNSIDKDNSVENEYNNGISDNIINNNTIKKDSTSCSQMESGFLEDYFSLPSKEFIDKYRGEYESVYLNSTSTELTLNSDGTYYVYPSNYKTIKHKIKWQDGKGIIVKWKDGEERRKKLYIAAKIMLNNNPDITLEQLVYCLIRERNDYYDNSDKQLHRDIILGIAKNAFIYRDIPFTKTIKHSAYRVNKEYWGERGYSARQASRFIFAERHHEEILSVYDFSKSVKENLEICKQYGIKAKKSLLYEIRKKYSETPDASTEEIPFKNKDIAVDSVPVLQQETEHSDWHKKRLSACIKRLEIYFRA